MIGLQGKCMFTKQVYPKPYGCIAHYFVVDWIALFGWLLMTQLIPHDSLTALIVRLHEGTTDGIITCITNHMKWLQVVPFNQPEARLIFTISKTA